MKSNPRSITEEVIHMLGKAEEADAKGAAKGIRDLQAENAALREIGEGASQPEQQKVCARERSGGVGRDVLCGETEGGSREAFDAHGGGTCRGSANHRASTIITLVLFTIMKFMNGTIR